jgi:hypothetical protein
MLARFTDYTPIHEDVRLLGRDAQLELAILRLQPDIAGK